jgi:hypothetical protein
MWSFVWGLVLGCIGTLGGILYLLSKAASKPKPVYSPNKASNVIEELYLSRDEKNIVSIPRNNNNNYTI